MNIQENNKEEIGDSNQILENDEAYMCELEKNLSEKNDKFIFFTAPGLYYDSNGKKQFTSYCPSWKNKTKEEYIKMQDTKHKVKCILTGKINQITVFDFDTEDIYWEKVKDLPILNKAYTVKTPRGYHVYFKYDSKIKTTTNKHLKIDIRNDDALVFGPDTKIDGTDDTYKIFHGGNLAIEAPEELLKLFKSNSSQSKVIPKKKFELKISKSSNSVALFRFDSFLFVPTNSDESFIVDLLKNIDYNRFYSGYDFWCKLIWAIKFSSIKNNRALDLADALSKCLPSYNGLEEVRKVYHSANKRNIGIGYLKALCKKSDPHKYLRIVAQHTEYIKGSDYDLAQVALLLNEYVVKVRGDIYVYQNPYWKKDDGKETLTKNYVRDILRDFLFTINGDIALQMKMAGDDDRNILIKKQKQILNTIEKINSSRGSAHIVSDFKDYLIPNDDLEFDTYQPFYFCFKNTAFDLRTNLEIYVKKEDYITQYANYEYSKPPQDKIELVRNLIEEILPNEDSRLCYISVLRSGMIGRLYEKFVMLNGGGGNGKGLISNLFKFMLGSSYHYRGNIITITDKIKAGANPEIANMNNKRCILFSEPSDTQQLNLGTIKAMTGDGDINARNLYSNDTLCRLPMTMLFECNKKPSINGRIDQSAIRRFINIFFPITYTSDPNLLGKSEFYKKANVLYKDEDWQHGHKLAFFHYLMQFDYIDIYEPASIRQATYDYLIDNDEFSIFMEKYYEESEDQKDFVTLKNIHGLYRSNFMRQGTRAYRQMTRKKFLEMMQENLFWKQKYTLDFKNQLNIDGVLHRNIFVKLKRRDDVADFE